MPVIQRFKLSRGPFDALIEGVEMDLGDRRYDTFADLYQSCIRVASAVGLMCVEIFGYSDPRRAQYATDLGVALQLTNILRDVRRISTRARLPSAGGSARAPGHRRGPAAGKRPKRAAAFSRRP